MKRYYYFSLKNYSDTRIRKASFNVDVEEGNDFMFKRSLEYVGIDIDQLDRLHYVAYIERRTNTVTGILSDYSSFSLMFNDMKKLSLRLTNG